MFASTGFLRGLLTVAAGQPALPTYLPDSLAQELPMFQRMRVRLVATNNRPEEDFPHKKYGKYDDSVVLDLDYTLALPR